MLWLPLFESFPDDKKTVHLKLLLKCETADAYLPRLWLWALKNRPDGLLLPGDAEDACKWKGKHGRLEQALKDAGWVDPDGKIHKWEEWAGSFAVAAEEERRAERERKAKYRMSRGTRPGQVPGRPAGQGRDNERDVPGTGGGTSRQNVPPESGGLSPGQTRDSRAPAKTREEEDKTENKKKTDAPAKPASAPEPEPPWGKKTPISQEEGEFGEWFRDRVAERFPKVPRLVPYPRGEVSALHGLRSSKLGWPRLRSLVEFAQKHAYYGPKLTTLGYLWSQLTKIAGDYERDHDGDLGAGEDPGFMGATLEELEGSNG